MALDVKELRRQGLRIGPFQISASSLIGWGLITPTTILYLIVTLLPICFAIYASLFDISLQSRTWEWTGVGNYSEVFELVQFWDSLARSIIFMVGSTAVQVIVGLASALVLNKITKGRKIVTALVFNAFLTPTIIVALLALFMFDQFIGVLHIFGTDVLGLWDGYVFGERALAMPAVILTSSWKFSVFIAIFALAQLQSIPPRYYELAKICGASSWEMFRDITFPRLRGVLAVAILLRSIFMFNKFDIIWMLTNGGPASATTTLPVLAYRETFIGSQYGLGNAIAVVMFLFLFVFAIIYFGVFDPTEEVEM